MQKRLFLVLNPCSGQKKANKLLTEILRVFAEDGWDCNVRVTTGSGDCREQVISHANECDLIVCIGGDGTFNECVEGLLTTGAKVPLGYIPAGSTNDFAASLGLSKNIVKAAHDIIDGTERSLDVGLFGERHFTYVASFGAFTKASYATPQNVKNSLGHFAYVLEGIKDITTIKPRHLRIESVEKTVEGDYLFGAVSNSTSVAGMLTISPKIVDMNDGKFEILLVRHPSNIIDLNEIVHALSVSDYSSYMLEFFSASELKVISDADMDWTLDGEWQKGCDSVDIKNIHNAITVITNQR
ncbi:MAG: YegS/Rv2252/BmrU family lipid kinase [Clostridia bacterium]|nr:YegS/Rv2252/BmrU family lipid kinase [Clostridia bacterium]